MTTDNKAMLDRVIAEVFNEDFVTVRVSSDEARGSHSVQVSRRDHEDRTAIIRAGYVWMEAFIPELNVQTSILMDDGEEDDDDEDTIEAYKEGELKKICRVMHAYLEGGGRYQRAAEPPGPGVSCAVRDGG